MKTNERPCRLIAFDLDGTVLDNRKRLSDGTLAALRAAGEAGVQLVPATGRIPAALPEPLRGLPGLRWAILINGALLYDCAGEKIVEREELPPGDALRVIDFLDARGVLYDCYQDNWGYIDRRFYEHASDYIDDPGVLDLLARLRTPVPSLRAFLAERGEPVQKLQLHTKDAALRLRLSVELRAAFPELSVTSSIPTNLEINAGKANKGDALLRLCARLGVAPEETAALGDGTNDLSLLRAAGLGIAMENADPALKAAADLVTASNEHDGAALAIRAILKGGCA